MKIISGAPQVSIVDPTLYNAFLSDFFYTIRKAFAHNFTDGDTLNVFAKTIHELVHSLKLGSKTAIKWFSENKMIVNPDKFKAITYTQKQIWPYTF